MRCSYGTDTHPREVAMESGRLSNDYFFAPQLDSPVADTMAPFCASVMKPGVRSSFAR
jgi:hypothetical protein